MSLTVTTFASGSTGNCYLVSSGTTHVLVDAGISSRRIVTSLRTLDLTLGKVSGVLITHEHSDHISGLKMLVMRKKTLPVWCSTGTGRHLTDKMIFQGETLHTVRPHHAFTIGNFTIFPFATKHDAAESLGYTFTDQNHKAAVVTDLGKVTADMEQALQGTDILVIESNHDVDMLRRGPYPPSLQERILGPYGHLSNVQCAQLCAKIRPKYAILAHISQDNNTPELARQTVQQAVAEFGTVVEVAPRFTMSQQFSVP